MDTLYHNGMVLTMDQPLHAAAVLTRDGRIVAVGAEEALLSLAREPLRRVNLAGHTLLPAFLDAHSHFAAAANSFLQVPLGECTDLEELLGRIRDFIRDRQIPRRGAMTTIPWHSTAIPPPSFWTRPRPTIRWWSSTPRDTWAYSTPRR